MTPVDVYEKWTLSPAAAWMAVAAVLAAFVAGFVVCLARARRRVQLARDAEASVGARPPALVEGADVVLVGTVRHHEDHDVAVKIRIDQRGTESESSGSWSHSWTEIDREIILAPFLLELASGETVLVHPPKNVDVADALDQKVWIDRNHRVLSAELMAGEQIFARGRLQRSDRAAPGGAYRDTAWGWELRPSAGGQMLLSSEPLGHGMRSRAAFHRFYAWTAVVLLCITQLTLAGFWLRVAGHTETATVTNNDPFVTTDDDDNSTYHCAIVVLGDQREIPCGNAVQRGDLVYVRMSSRASWQLGHDATITWYHALIVIGIAGLYGLVYRARRRSSRPWFRRKVNNSGTGKLPDPPAT